jgi:hypothetical protein
MNSSVGIRNRNRQKARPRSTARREPKTAAETATRFFVFTIDADSAQIVKVEALNKRGRRRELSDEDKAHLLRERSDARLEDMLERTFEAGIACALGDETAQEGQPETDEDVELRHLLLARLIEHSEVGDMLRSEALNRAILEALIQHSIDRAPITGERRMADRPALDTHSVRTH